MSGCKGIFDKLFQRHGIVIQTKHLELTMNRLIAFIVAVIAVTGCNSSKESSPFSEILNQAPYSTLTDSIKAEPDRDDLYFRRAVLLNKNNFPEPALADFRKAWSLDRQETYAVGVSNSLLEKNVDEAIAFLREAVKDIPESIFLQLSLARAYDAQNKTAEALSVTHNILAQEPNQVNTLVFESELLQKKGDTAASIIALQKARVIAPGNKEIDFKLAYQYAETKNSKVLALTDSLILRDSAKVFADPYYIKGMYYSNINDHANAIRWFNETIKQSYNYLNAYIEKGKVFLKQKKTADAFKAFQLANTIDPAFADAWFWIAKCQELNGQKEEAKLSYQKAYSLDKTFTEAKEAADAVK